MNKSILLASQSPRRKELLEQAGFKVTVQRSNVEEIHPESCPLAEIPIYLAKKKAAAVAQISKTSLPIVAADTIVLLGDTVLEKPKDRASAIATIQQLSGQVHEVITGVCIIRGTNIEEFSCTTKVYFHELSLEQITYYVDQYQPMDKAGAYAIQEWIGLIGIKKIEGDYYNVVGLPVQAIYESLMQ